MFARAHTNSTMAKLIAALALLAPAYGLQAPARRGVKVAPARAEPDVKVSETTGRQVDMHNYRNIGIMAHIDAGPCPRPMHTL